jgi:hypothetical protein
VVAATSTTVPQATPTPQPPETSQSSSDTVYVGNTDGEGVYVRATPSMADRVRAYPDGTPLTIIGDDVDGDGQHWKHIKTPDGLEGYVPAMYTTTEAPQ